MKRLLVTGLLCLPILASGQSSEPMVRETFDYADLNPIFCIGGSADGWIGGWERERGDDAIIRRGNLGDDASTAGLNGRAVLPFVRAGIRYNRRLERIQDDGDVLWLAYDVDFQDEGGANNVGNITLTRANQQVFTVGRKFGNRKIGLVWPGVTTYNTDIDAIGKHRLVVKIQFSGDTGPEQAWLWVDPELEEGQSPEEALADLAVPSAGMPGLTLNIGIDGVQMKVEGTPPLRVDFDNIFLGRDYASISPDLTSTRAVAYQDLPLIIFPNPTDGPLTTRFTNPGANPVSIELYSMEGRKLRVSAEMPLPAGPQEIPLTGLLANLSAGQYLVSVISGQYRGTGVVVVK